MAQLKSYQNQWHLTGTLSPNFGILIAHNRIPVSIQAFIWIKCLALYCIFMSNKKINIPIHIWSVFYIFESIRELWTNILYWLFLQLLAKLFNKVIITMYVKCLYWCENQLLLKCPILTLYLNTFPVFSKVNVRFHFDFLK